LLISKFEGGQGVMKKGPEVKVTLWISLLYVNGIEIAGPLRIEICDFSRL